MGFSRRSTLGVDVSLIVIFLLLSATFHPTDSLDPDKLGLDESNVTYPAVSSVIIDCPLVEGEDQPVVWVTPQRDVILSDFSLFPWSLEAVNKNQSTKSVFLSQLNCSDQSVSINLSEDLRNRVSVATNGSLLVKNFGWIDRGPYTCHVGQNKSSQSNVHLDPEYRWTIYLISLIYGFATAGAFLLITLLFKFIVFVLET
jgi:hypothetical protein